MAHIKGPMKFMLYNKLHYHLFAERLIVGAYCCRCEFERMKDCERTNPQRAAHEREYLRRTKKSF